MGAVFGLFAGFYFWTPKILGKVFNDFHGRIHFWTLFVGVNINESLCFSKRDKGRNLKNFTGKRQFSTNSSNSKNFPIKKNILREKPNDDFKLFYKNIYSKKKEIYKQLKNRSGVYLFINNVTNDYYVGSSIVLSKRIASHLYHGNSNTKKNTNIILYRSMRKYGLENFSLAILEFCQSDTLVTAKLEQKWIDLYLPKYNILKIAGSSSGFRHSIETIDKLKSLFKRENHPKFGTTISNETRKAISDGVKEFYRHHKHQSKGLKGVLSKQYGIGGKLVYCYNNKGAELVFPSINAAKQYFKVRWTSIKNNLDTKNTIDFKGEKWKFKSIPDEKN